LNHCELAGQKVYLCGVSAHFQNGIAERIIKDLTEQSRTSLLHAVHSRWPSAITIKLWPYALRYINDVYNATPALRSGQTPLERFSATAVRPKVLDFHPPFCPVLSMYFTMAFKEAVRAQTSGSGDPDVVYTLESHLYTPGRLLLS
jgi:hypothetical protein